MEGRRLAKCLLNYVDHRREDCSVLLDLLPALQVGLPGLVWGTTSAGAVQESEALGFIHFRGMRSVIG